ncbi:hypothetical protein [uncultured Hymenobacter sp.]|uniref:hypothetical protein n=1 Tax=uncultured Hymenobacter sp. TaxID=170016 RepID=UPI0035CC76E6
MAPPENNQKQFIVIGYLQLPGASIPTSKIRVTIAAETQQQAEEKFKTFLLNKAEPVVSSSTIKTDFEQISDMFRDMFKNL